MALGFVAGRMRAIDDHHADEINALVMNFALPASLFVATASAPPSEIVRQGPLFVILGVVMLLLASTVFSVATLAITIGILNPPIRCAR
jgi:malonate transporter and related proteins